MPGAQEIEGGEDDVEDQRADGKAAEQRGVADLADHADIDDADERRRQIGERHRHRDGEHAAMGDGEGSLALVGSHGALVSGSAVVGRAMAGEANRHSGGKRALIGQWPLRIAHNRTYIRLRSIRSRERTRAHFRNSDFARVWRKAPSLTVPEAEAASQRDAVRGFADVPSPVLPRRRARSPLGGLGGGRLLPRQSRGNQPASPGAGDSRPRSRHLDPDGRRRDRLGHLGDPFHRHARLRTRLRHRLRCRAHDAVADHRGAA